nr:MAG TPA: hypothetical protein [Caudoviricetes sp.]
MRRRKGGKVITMEGVLKLWKVKLPDGRSAELQAKTRKKAVEQAAMIWALPVAWMLEKAKVVEIR